MLVFLSRMAKMQQAKKLPYFTQNIFSPSGFLPICECFCCLDAGPLMYHNPFPSQVLWDNPQLYIHNRYLPHVFNGLGHVSCGIALLHYYFFLMSIWSSFKRKLLMNVWLPQCEWCFCFGLLKVAFKLKWKHTQKFQCKESYGVGQGTSLKAVYFICPSVLYISKLHLNWTLSFHGVFLHETLSNLHLC